MKLLEVAKRGSFQSSCANLIGVLSSLYYILNTFPYVQDDSKRIITYTLFPGLFIVIISSILSFITLDSNLPFGITANIIQVLFFASPAIQIVKIVRNRNSLGIHARMNQLSVLNCLVWTFYGLVKVDLFIIVPNGLSLVVCSLQMGLRYVYPPSHGDEVDKPRKEIKKDVA